MPKDINDRARIDCARSGVSKREVRSDGREDRKLYYQERVAMIWIEKVMSGTWYFSNFFFVILYDFLCCFTPPRSFSLSFTLPRKDNTHAIDLMTQPSTTNYYNRRPVLSTI